MVVCKSMKKYDGHMQIYERNMMVVCTSMKEKRSVCKSIEKYMVVCISMKKYDGRMQIYEEI